MSNDGTQCYKKAIQKIHEDAIINEYQECLLHPNSLKSQFIHELRTMGFEFEVLYQLKGYIPKFKHELLPMLIKYYEKAIEENENVETFSQFFGINGFDEVVPMLIEKFRSDNPQPNRWRIGDYLYSIKSKKYVDEYIEIITHHNNHQDFQMIVLLLGKLKAEKAIPRLTELLKSNEVKGQSICALGQFKKEELRPYFEECLKSNNSWHKREAKKAIAKLDKSKDKLV